MKKLITVLIAIVLVGLTACNKKGGIKYGTGSPQNSFTYVVNTKGGINDSMIFLDGAQGIVFDGRVNRSGATDLTISQPEAFKAFEFANSPDVVVYNTIIIEGVVGDIASINY